MDIEGAEFRVIEFNLSRVADSLQISARGDGNTMFLQETSIPRIFPSNSVS